MQDCLLSSNRHDWRTPRVFFEDVVREFGPFDTDAAASADNALCPHFWDEQADALKQDWAGRRIWCNPPYGRTIKKWVAKASSTIGTGGLVVMLIPSRTDTSYFHDYIWQKPGVEVRFLRGRLKFDDGKDPAPFPSMLVVFR
jgi:site-specific DNA-methyltransferase (adenine-specific)